MSRIRDLLPLLTELPDAAINLGLTLDADSTILGQIDPVDPVVAGLLDVLAWSLFEQPDQGLALHLPGLARWAREPLEPLLRTARAQNVAARHGLLTVDKLGLFSPTQLLALPQVGSGTVLDFLRAGITVALFGPPAGSAPYWPHAGQGLEDPVPATEPPVATAMQGGEVRDLLPLMCDLPSPAAGLGVAMHAPAEALAGLDPTDRAVDDLFTHLADILIERHDRTLIGQLPGLRSCLAEPLAPFLRDQRARNLSGRDRIVTVADLARYTPERLFAIRGAGEKTVRDFLRAALILGLIGVPRPGPSVVETAAEPVIAAETEDDTGVPEDMERAGQGAVEEAALAEAAAEREAAAATAVDALRVLASWASQLGPTIPLGHVLGPPLPNTPPDVAECWRQLAELPAGGLADPQLARPDIPEKAAALLEALPEAQRRVFEQRILKPSPPTLEQLAQVVGVTRERIRQQQVKAQERVTALIATEPFRTMRWASHVLRELLGVTAPADDDEVRLCLGTALCELLPERIAAASPWLLWTAGPYRVRDGWLELEGATLPTPAELAAMADATGVIPDDEAQAWLSERGIRPAFHDQWVERSGRFRRHEGKLLLWGGSLVDKCVTLLALRGHPATPEELVAELGEGHNPRGARDRLFNDPRLMRINRNKVALREWGFEEYSGIVEEIAQRIDEGDGRAQLSELVQVLPELFGVKASSVRVYAEAPMFILEGGWVRKRTAEEPFEITQTLAGARGVFAAGPHHVSVLVPVDRDVLRGSGRPCPPAAAGALGLIPGDRAKFTWEAGTLLLSWPLTAALGPALGSVRDLAASVGARDGDAVRLDFDGTVRTVSATRVARETPELSDLERLQLISGLKLSESDALSQLAAALHICAVDLRRCLVDRGDGAAADLLPRPNLDDDLAAALAELEALIEED